MINVRGKRGDIFINLSWQGDYGSLYILSEHQEVPMPCEFFVTIPFSSERPIHKINISSHWQRIQRDTACWYLIGYMWQQWHNLCNICDKLSRSIILCFLGDRLMRKYFSDKSEPISFDVFLKLSLMKTLRRRDEKIVDCFSQKWTLLTWK